MLTQEKLKQLLKYNADTGVFMWRARSGWKHAGSVAGCVDRSDGYRRIWVGGKLHYAHRLAWFYVTGLWPANQTDHKNHKRDDNRIVNLREVTNAENGRNQSLHCTNTSGCMGVHWHKGKEKWLARIDVNGKRLHIGSFDNIDFAIAARKRAEREYGFHINHGG